MFKHVTTAALAAFLLAAVPGAAFAQNGPDKIRVPKDGEPQKGLPVPEVDSSQEKGADRTQLRRTGRFQLDFEKVESVSLHWP